MKMVSVFLAFLLSQSICAEEAVQKHFFASPSLRAIEMQRSDRLVGMFVGKMSLSRERKPSVLWLSLSPDEKEDSQLLFFSSGVKGREFFPDPIRFPEKEFMPTLYYEHFEPEIKWFKDEGYDDVGRIWKLSKRTKLFFPFARWEYPGIRDRVFLGVGFRIDW